MKRVTVYVDGFNLYYGLRSKGWHRYQWLDLVQLAHLLLKPDQVLQQVHYFTSRIRASAHNMADVRGQNLYLDALATRAHLSCHFGHYLEKPRQCRSCGARWMDYEEKMTDVNIAVQLLSDAHADRFDTALLISADSDLTAPLRQLRSHFADKRLIAVFPPNRRSFELGQAAHGSFTLGEANLRRAQLPDTLVRSDGFALQRPLAWA